MGIGRTVGRWRDGMNHAPIGYGSRAVVCSPSDDVLLALYPSWLGVCV